MLFKQNVKLGSQYGVVANVSVCDIDVSGFEL